MDDKEKEFFINQAIKEHQRNMRISYIIMSAGVTILVYAILNHLGMLPK